MQTFGNALKTKDVQAIGNKQAHAEVMVNQWAIYDAYSDMIRIGNIENDGYFLALLTIQQKLVRYILNKLFIGGLGIRMLILMVLVLNSLQREAQEELRGQFRDLHPF